jgi:hypothetical protein
VLAVLAVLYASLAALILGAATTGVLVMVAVWETLSLRPTMARRA